MKQSRLLPLVFLLLYLATLTHGHSCTTAKDSNWLTHPVWANCFEASDGNMIGYSVGSLYTGPFGSPGQYASWNIDYNNNIAWLDNPVSTTQYWNYGSYVQTCYYTDPNSKGCTYPCNYQYQCNQYDYAVYDGNGDFSYTQYYAYIYQADSSVVVSHIYTPCHQYCSSCNVKWDNTQCNSCWNVNGNAYRWLDWTANSYVTTCHYYCPGSSYHGYNNLYVGQYIQSTGSTVCARCYSLCSTCSSSSTYCTTCITTAYLTQAWSTCNSRFSGHSSCQANNQCLGDCPANLYFKATKTSSGSYPNTPSISTTNVCYLCDTYCLQCTQQQKTDCTTCYQGRAWKWLVWNTTTQTTRCDNYCPNDANYHGYTNQYTGQYIASASDIVCTPCSPTCSACNDYTGGTVCTVCVSTAYLTLNQATCQSRFNSDSRCVTNNQCLDSNCPAQLYFQLAKGSSTATYSETPSVTNTNVCYLCHATCLTCTNRLNTTCTSCYPSRAYRWLVLNSTTSYQNICGYTCPNDWNRAFDNQYVGQYIATVSDPVCHQCNTSCSICADLAGGNTCTGCVAAAYLIENFALCNTTWPNDPNCYADSQCLFTNCPTYFYFKVAKGSSATTYPNAPTLARSNVCYLCHSYCYTCTEQLNTTCGSCYAGRAYLWLNWNSTTTYRTICDTRCPNDWNNAYSNQYIGQYIATVSDPLCHQCNTSCSICADLAGGNTCTGCVAAAYLIENFALCNTTWPNDPNCYADSQCLFTNCPTYFYFKVAKGSSATTYPNAPTLARSNVCYLCHSYCYTCTEQLNTTCGSCYAGRAYLWLNWNSTTTYRTICDTRCPNDWNNAYSNQYIGQYIATVSDPLCHQCNTSCSICADLAGGNTCTGCVAAAYLIENFALCNTTWPNDPNCYADSQCLFTNCPTYFYFKVAKGSSATTYPNAPTLARSNVCYLCHSYCYTCTEQLNTTCGSCYASRAYLWLVLNSTTSYQTVCDNRCPNDWNRAYDNLYTGQYIATVSDPLCYECNETCSVCADLMGGLSCSVCVVNAALIQNYALCTSTFPDSSDITNCQTDDQCVWDCPANLYFELSRARTSNASYPFTAAGPINRRRTNVCYLCHKYCLTCSDQYDYTCTACAATYYLWQQSSIQTNYTTRCNYYCNQGELYTAGTTLGEYIISSTTRTCGVCATGCKFCAYAAAQCYICQDSHFLVDDRATCNSRFNCQECVNTVLVTDGCQATDKICRATNCPSFFYFRVNRTSTGNIHDDPTNPIYQYFTYASSVNTNQNGYDWGSRSDNSSYKDPLGSIPSYYYRLKTNLCVLCDRRCMQCFGPTNLNCTLCTNYYYKWTNAPVCSSQCPIGQFQQNISAPYPLNQTTCANCNFNCISCVGYFDNCTLCKVFPATNYSFLYTFYNQNSTCMYSCPTSSNQTAVKGYYGSIATMTCYTCPGGCSDCNINQVIDTTNYPELKPIVCDTDNYCTKGIQCTACLQGFSLVSGQCIAQSTCRLYSYYQKTANSSSTWSPTNCKCLPGFYFSATISCSACDIACLTCNGPSSNNCLTCSQGYSLNTATSICAASNSGSQIKTSFYWRSVNATNTTVSSNQPNQKKTCGSYYTLFGYKSALTTSSYLSYVTGTIAAANYYAISFKVRILFIDNWDSTAGIYFKLDSDVNPSFIYTYNNYGAVGEQQCGTNAPDYLLSVEGKILLTPAAGETHTVTLYPNMNPVWTNATGFSYYWGVQSALFSVLACHSDCSTCNGPSANECTSCSDPMKKLQNNSCICNASAGYYYINISASNTCQLGCDLCNSTSTSSTCYYTDPVTATCVSPPTKNCSAPNLYGSSDVITNSYGACVQSCGNTSYAVPSKMLCTTDCTKYNLSYYKGATTNTTGMWTCVKTCPTGLILDITTATCVTICPSSNTTRYFLLLENRTSNPMCGTNCTTGYEYDQQNTCVVTCPAGYYTQTRDAHNKCVQTCLNGTYGDNVTMSCVNICPTPSIADPTKNLCVNQCPTNYYFQINSTNGSRNCVSGCENGQWLNPYYLNCSKNPLDCPDGTYADNTTNKCQFRCLTWRQVGQNSTKMCQTSCITGFAFWQAGVCVQICNNTMFGYKDNTTSQCVSTCNSNTTNTFADVQAKRTCVRNCSATPFATFGDKLTGTCVKECPISNQYGDPFHSFRLCVTVCTNFPNQTYSLDLTKLCVATCPVSYYGDNTTTTGVGICSTTCPNNTYANPLNNLCVTLCPFRYYGSPINGRPCVQTCPFGYFAINLTSNRVCTAICDAGFWADNFTSSCYNVKTSCSNNTYADQQKRLCVTGTNCTVGRYADPLTKGCEPACNSSSYFGDPSTNLCVTLCPTSPDYYSQNGICNFTCTGGFFADYVANRTCLVRCSSSPVALYGNTAFRCVTANLCGTGLFGNNVTRLCSRCNETNGTLPFGDPITYQCVMSCPATYYGNPATNLCVLQCDFSILQYADNKTGNCTTMCSLGTFGVNSTVGPICQTACPPNSFALDSNRVCMLNCGANFFGDPVTGKCYNSSLSCSPGYFGNNDTQMCVLPIYCQTVAGLHYYADNITKMCIPKCTSPNYGLNTTWYCMKKCPNPLYAENTTRMCVVVTGCKEFNFSFADSQINVCVTQCSTAPIFTFSENITYTCVIPADCPSTMLAENVTQSCVYSCHNNASYTSFADPYKSNRCVARCPDGYFGDTLTGLCVSVCPGINYFRDNSTQRCVYSCPAANSTLGTVDTFGDNITDTCVPRCPPNTFAQVILNRTCVQTCLTLTWGNSVTRMCVNRTDTDCPAGTWGDNFTNLCTGFCTTNPSNSQIYYGQNSTKMCVSACPVPSFAFIPTRVCIDICPATTDQFSGYFGDPGTSPTRLCVEVCNTGGLYRDIANNRTCQPSCTYNSTYKTYKDPTTMTCEASCPTFPQYLYAWGTNSSTASCLSSCPTGYMNDANMSCVTSCPVLLDPTTNRCVSICPFSSATNTTLYANLITRLCVAPSSCPNATYASDDLLTCVSNCPNNTYIYLKNCVAFCPFGFYINYATQSCVTPANCPTNFFANNQTHSCVSSCTNGTFADSSLRMCLFECYGTNYADPMTGLCSANCTSGLIKNSMTLSCISNCSTGFFFNPSNGSCGTSCPSPYFADTARASCVSICSSNPMTFASTSLARACVTTCPATAQWFDLVNRVCTANCPNSTYQYNVNSSCVSFCPQPYLILASQFACVLNCTYNGTTGMYADSTTQTCVSTCPTGFFKDPTTFKCVASCPINPARYFAYTPNKECVLTCTNNTFADSQKGACVTQCSTVPLLYADSSTWRCVPSCPVSNGTYADPTTQKCVATCPANYYADNRQRNCLSNCSNIFFADSLTKPPSCVSVCSNGTYADPVLFKCVVNCSVSYFAFAPNKTCLQSCPFGYFANPTTGQCVQQCSWSPNLYADSFTRTCSSSCSNNQFRFKSTSQTYGFCLFYCPNGTFSDFTSMNCVSKCPNGFYGATVNNTCNIACPEDQFMDNVNNLCQKVCPSSNLLFGEPFSRTCVTSCNSTGYKILYADTSASLCATTCSGLQYADPVTMKCVNKTSCTSGLNADPYLKQCVSRCYNQTYAYQGICYPVCPNSTLFADEASQSCVVATGCANGLFADPTKGKCVKFCDIASNRFADVNSNTCIDKCVAPLFADNISRTCTTTCPKVPLYFGLNTSQICVQTCPSPSFGDPILNLCVSKCSNGLFGHNTTRICISQCPYGSFGDNTSNLCVRTCPSPPSGLNYFGDAFTGTCVFNCSNSLFADAANNRECQQTCLSPNFAENSTMQCVPFCLTGFSDIRTGRCIAICSKGYYGHNKVCYPGQCPSATIPVYADDTTNRCVTKCPNGTFGEFNTMKCVTSCPIAYNEYADLMNNVCVTDCVNNTRADPSTRTCVSKCPSVPNLFNQNSICVQNCSNGLYADALTRNCVSNCSNGTFTDQSTYTCVAACPTKPMLYADSLTGNCVSSCVYMDRFADNMTRSCVFNCTNGTFADITTRSCRPICSAGYFGVNSTLRCQLGCITPSFADSLIRLCVQRCSVDPIYYGDPFNNTCVKKCPSSSYGSPLTQQCVYNAGNVSTCPGSYFADTSTQLCVQVCPMKLDLYAEPLSKTCKSSCVSPYFADNSTMKCVLTCPVYPSYFANNVAGRCVKYCPVNTFADNTTRRCVGACPNGTYAENSTWKCVSTCPNKPLTFRDSANWKCVSQCPSNFYADMMNLQCLSICPPLTFSRNDTRQCVKVCPIGSYAYLPTRSCVSSCYNSTFADNSTWSCVLVCPRSPPLYAHPINMTCLSSCTQGMFASDNTRECLYACPPGFYKQNSSNSCVRTCSLADNSYADNLTGYCVRRCSVASYADPTTMRCVGMCPDQPLMYAQNNSQSCLKTCPDPLFGQNKTRSCVNNCPNGSLSLSSAHLCVFVCPLGFYADRVTQFCFTKCLSPYYGDPSTRTCVLECPINQLLYADNTTQTCVKSCPSGSYAYQWAVTCLPSCPIAVAPYVQTYAADYDNTCVVQCAYPFYAYDATKKCVTSCPNPYFNNLEKHNCDLCPINCSACTGLNACTSCKSTFFLQNGVCVANCTLIYYANPNNGRCVVSKECAPNFGQNSTYQCLPNCNAGQYKNTNAYRCDACPPTCVTCTSLTNCLSCVSTSVSFNNFCYSYCNTTNTTLMYFSSDNKTCTATCPNGTYASVVFCKLCASQCITCTVSASNCTNCSNGKYLFNYGCFDSCPAQYRPNANRVCVFCNSTCGAGLTFATNVTNVNGQTSMFINFNSAVSISGNLYNTISVNTNTKKRLLANTSNVGYQIVMIDAQTLQIVFPPGTSSTDFNIQITNPQNIVDANGNLPSSLSSTVSISGNDHYSSSSSSTSSFPLYFTFLAVICIITFIFDIEFMKFLQLIYVHYFIVLNLPPEFIKVFSALRYSTLYYLPSMFQADNPVLRPSVPTYVFSTVGDYNFLRNAGFAFTPLVIILIVWGLLKLLSVPEINKFKDSRIWCSKMLQEKFKYAVLLEWVGMFLINTVFFAFLQLRDYNIYNTFTQVSLILAHLFIIFFAVICVLVAYRVLNFYKEYPTLSENLKKAADIILNDQEADNLVSTNIFLSQKKKIDMRNMFYPKINNENIFPFKCIYKYNILALLCPNVIYLRAIILSAIIALANTSTSLQMGLCIPLNILVLMYFSKARPYSFKFKHYRIKNYFAIFHEICIIILELLLLALGEKDKNNATASQKEQFSRYIIYYLTLVCTLSFLYHIFSLTVYLHRRIWLKLIESEIFKKNFPEKYAEYQAAKNKNKKLVKTIDPKAKQALKNMIKGYKKSKSALRPTDEEKNNSQLPMKYKITYFDRTETSSMNSRTTLTKTQKKKMLKEIFNPQEKMQQIKDAETYEELHEKSEVNEFDYEEYEEEIEIKAKDLSKYVANADAYLKAKQED